MSAVLVVTPLLYRMIAGWVLSMCNLTFTVSAEDGALAVVSVTELVGVTLTTGGEGNAVQPASTNPATASAAVTTGVGCIGFRFSSPWRPTLSVWPPRCSKSAAIVVSMSI
jgi:hypothetical protein